MSQVKALRNKIQVYFKKTYNNFKKNQFQQFKFKVFNKISRYYRDDKTKFCHFLELYSKTKV